MRGAKGLFVKFKICTAVIAMALSLASIARAQELRCEIAEKYVCETGGCKQGQASIWNMIDRAKKTYARCDRRGCDTYQANFSDCGIFMNIEVPGRGTIAKMATLNEPVSGIKAFSFHEVVTQLHAVLVSFGTCKPI
jgi:hypothetical protein